MNTANPILPVNVGTLSGLFHGSVSGSQSLDFVRYNLCAMALKARAPPIRIPEARLIITIIIIRDCVSVKMYEIRLWGKGSTSAYGLGIPSKSKPQKRKEAVDSSQRSPDPMPLGVSDQCKSSCASFAS